MRACGYGGPRPQINDQTEPVVIESQLTQGTDGTVVHDDENINPRRLVPAYVTKADEALQKDGFKTTDLKDMPTALLIKGAHNAKITIKRKIIATEMVQRRFSISKIFKVVA